MPTQYFLLLALLAITPLKAQELLTELPETREAFIASEPRVLATIDWLEVNTYSEDTQKVHAQRTILMAWLTNSPTVTIEFDADLLAFTEKNPELLFVFMGGWTRYCLQNNYSKDVIQGHLAGFKSVIDVYQKMKLKKNKKIEKLIKLDSQGKLETYIRANFNKK